MTAGSTTRVDGLRELVGSGIAFLAPRTGFYGLHYEAVGVSARAGLGRLSASGAGARAVRRETCAVGRRDCECADVR
jgi:hypothetical protein